MDKSIVSTEAMTLREMAAYIRLTQGAAKLLAEKNLLPGYYVDDEWFFLKPEIDRWLANRGRKEAFADAAGAWADDPYFDELLENIYRERGRAMLEGS